MSGTSTQVLLTYDAPDENACTVQVSEAPGLAPLVPDVNPALFAGADRDDRGTSIVNGAKRIVLLGKRAAELASDGKNYSRALQAFTDHYYQITCGAETATGTFKTGNIAVGNTYSETLPADPNRPGDYAWPTRDMSLRRGRPNFISEERYIDPFTGALIRPFTLTNDAGKYPAWYFTADRQTCADKMVADAKGKMGYYCIIPDYTLYWIDPVTGESRYLYQLWIGGQGDPKMDGWESGWCGTKTSSFDPVDPTVFYCHQGNAILRVKFFGDNMGRAGGEATSPVPVCNSGQSNRPCFSLTNMTRLSQGEGFNQLVTQFDSRFEPTRFTCELFGVARGHGVFQCLRRGQDTYGWIIVMDFTRANPYCTKSNNCVIGAMPSWQPAACRWCSIHSVNAVKGSNTWTNLQPQELHYATMVVSPISTQSQSCPANQWNARDCITLTVSGEPRDFNATDPRDVDLMAAEPGDYFVVGNEGNRNPFNERFRLIAKQGNSWTLERHIGYTQAQAVTYSPVYLYAKCSSMRLVQNTLLDVTWHYAADPHAANADGKSVQTEPAAIGHASFADQIRAGGGYGTDCEGLTNGCFLVKYGPGAQDPTLKPNARLGAERSTFAGHRVDLAGNNFESYVSWHQLNAPDEEKLWFGDTNPFLRFGEQPEATLVSGTLYKLKAGYLDRKKLPTLAVSGPNVLLDVSGPGSRLGDGADDNYKYCVVVVAGECAPGSQPGDAFLNVPRVQRLGCTGAGIYFIEGIALDLCLANNSFPYSQINQYGFVLGQDIDNTSTSRVLTKGMQLYRRGWLPVLILPDASWLMWNVGSLDGNNYQILAAKAPPMSKPDGVDRSTFIPVSVSVTPPADKGVTNAVIEFGYAENGDPNSHFCTSRREACVSNSSWIDENRPFFFETSESYDGLACASGCILSIPALPQHMTYFKVLFRNDSGEVVATGNQGIAMEFDMAVGGQDVAPAITVNLRPGGAVVRGGQTVQFNAVVSGANRSVKWFLNPEVGSISDSGLYTAPAQVTQTQMVTVIATSLADPTRSGSAPIVLTTSAGADGPNNAACGGITAPDAAQPGQQFAASVVMRNNGERIWRSSSFEPNTPHALASQNPNDTDRWGFNRAGLPLPFVLPNQSVTFSFPAKAPATPGTYAFDWRMVQDPRGYFGATCSKSIAVR